MGAMHKAWSPGSAGEQEPSLLVLMLVVLQFAAYRL
jgi:hypothetical protein